MHFKLFLCRTLLRSICFLSNIVHGKVRFFLKRACKNAAGKACSSFFRFRKSLLKRNYMALLKCKNLAIGYEGKAIFRNINFEVNAGEYLYIVGHNGSGKSTLMKTIIGLQKPLDGEIEFSDGLLENQIGYLPQQTAIQKNFPASVPSRARNFTVSIPRKAEKSSPPDLPKGKNPRPHRRA